jgi:hypothetical protein
MKEGISLSMDQGTLSSENKSDLDLQGFKVQLYRIRTVANKEFRMTQNLVPQYLLTNIHDIFHDISYN